jgi:AcrR family transcriptional regulator
VTQRSSFSEYRLPPGRHGIPPEEVAANQRWRLLGAATEVLAESGRLATTSTAVSRRAGVSPATFYKHFDNISDCLLAAYEMSAESLLEAVGAGCREPQLPWPRRLRDSLDSSLRFLAAEPAIAAMLGAVAPVAEPPIAVARQGLVERLAGLLAEGRGGDEAEALPASAESLLVNGALTLVSDRVEAGDGKRLPELAPDLAELLGATVAAGA